MKNPTQRQQQVIRFLKWVKRYPGFWELICTPSDEKVKMDLRKMRMLIEKLYNDGFYELIFVLLTVHRKAPFMEGLHEYVALDLTTKHWCEDQDYMIRELIKYLE